MDAALNNSVRARIAQGFSNLPVEQRAVLHRCFYRGWTTHRTAAHLGMSDQAVKATLHDALRKLLIHSITGTDPQRLPRGGAWHGSHGL
jgi:DNA-directed RNA polymerase specialized sigma24 family protein